MILINICSNKFISDELPINGEVRLWPDKLDTLGYFSWIPEPEGHAVSDTNSHIPLTLTSIAYILNLILYPYNTGLQGWN